MSYIEDNLTRGESIVLLPKKSKIPLFWSWVGGILFSWFLLIPLIMAIKYQIEFSQTEYAVTDKGVIEKRGLFNVVCDEMKLERIENITVRKTFWGSLFKYGTVCIQGANRNHVYFTGIKDPEMVKQSISQLISD